LFSETTAESINVHGQSSTMTSPQYKSREEKDNSKIKFQNKK